VAVCPLSYYDVILGKIWLAKFDPLIFHKTNKITFQFENKQVTIKADLERRNSLVSSSTFPAQSAEVTRPSPSSSTRIKPHYQQLLLFHKFMSFQTNFLTFFQTIYPQDYLHNSPMTSNRVKIGCISHKKGSLLPLNKGNRITQEATT
jgi:hypothetical protein